MIIPLHVLVGCSLWFPIQINAKLGNKFLPSKYWKLWTTFWKLKFVVLN